jgi:outer membrane protein OmpA-like peptidoglycan-associated protein
MTIRRRGAWALATLLVAGCAAAPDTSPEVEQARRKVDSLAANPRAVAVANRDLTAARGALELAERSLKERADREIVAHHAYLAERQAETGLARVEEADARESLANAEEERQAILLQTRERQAQAAEREAQASQESAMQARAELEQLRQDYAALEAKQTERGMVLTLGDVLFDTAQSTLKPGAMDTIDRLAQFLSRNETTRIRIEGHTDSVGTEEYNAALSERRARAVADAVAARGVPGSRIVAIGRGESLPVASNDSPGGRQQNRRVEIVFSEPDGSFASGD